MCLAQSRPFPGQVLSVTCPPVLPVPKNGDSSGSPFHQLTSVMVKILFSWYLMMIHVLSVNVHFWLFCHPAPVRRVWFHLFCTLPWGAADNGRCLWVFSFLSWTNQFSASPASSHFSASHHLTLDSHSHVNLFLYWANHLWMPFTRYCFPSARERGIITFLPLLTSLLLIQILCGHPPSLAGCTDMQQSVLTNGCKILSVDNIGSFWAEHMLNKEASVEFRNKYIWNPHGKVLIHSPRNINLQRFSGLFLREQTQRLFRKQPKPCPRLEVRYLYPSSLHKKTKSISANVLSEILFEACCVLKYSYLVERNPKKPKTVFLIIVWFHETGSSLAK